MPIVLPPPKKKEPKGSAWVQFVSKWAKQYPSLRANAPDIQAAANAAHIDPVYFASVLLAESGADYKSRPSSSGAVGVGQLMPSTFVGKPVPWDPTRTITSQDLADPQTNLRLSAYFLATQIGRHGYDNAYTQGYNPADPNRFAADAKIKGFIGTYIPKTPSTAPPTPVGPQAPAGAAPVPPDRIFDHWAVLGNDGRIKFTKIVDPSKPPANVLKYGPTPLTQTSFLQTWKQQYQDTFFAYTGHQASGKQIASILKNAPSLYTLSNTLAQTKTFQTSPTYKAHAPGIIGIAKQMFGEEWKPDRAFVAKAIAQNWDQATLETNLRARPEYERGPAFKDDVAKLTNVYGSIYGKTDNPLVRTAMTALARKGWTQDETAAWLRTQPEYKNSEEFKSRALSFAQQIGLLTGQMPTLTADQATLGGPPAAPKVPDYNRGETGIPLAVSGTYPGPPARPDNRAGVRGA